MLRKMKPLSLLMLMFLLPGCSLFSGGGTTEKIPLEEIILQASQTSVLVDSSITFSVTPTPNNANTFNAKSYSAQYLEYFIDEVRFDKASSSVEYTFDTIGSFSIHAKYCTHQQHSDTTGDLVSNTITVNVSEIDANLVMHVQQPEENALSISQPTNLISQSWNYTLTTSGETRNFTYKAETANGASLSNGIFYFSSSFSVYWTIKDSSNNSITTPSYVIDHLDIKLDIGKTYTFVVKKGSTSGNLAIEAYAPNGKTNVTGRTNVYDCIWYDSQEINYQYTPTVTGYYNLSTSYSVYWVIYDSFGNIVKTLSYSTDSIFIDLSTSETYLIVIKESSTHGNIELAINVPNPIINISGKQKIYDCMRYDNQRNSYTYLATISGGINLKCSFKVNWTIHDSFGNLVKSSGYSVESFSFTLELGQDYSITMIQSASMGNYSLKLTN